MTNILKGDQASYFDAGNFMFKNFNAHEFRTFGYPLLLGSPRFLNFQVPYGYWPIILNGLFLIGILLLIKKISIILNLKISIVFNFLLSFCFGFLLMLNFALTEIGFSFFLINAVYNLIKFLSNRSFDKLFLFSFFLGFATLFRPGMYIFVLILIPVFLIFLFFKKYAVIKGILFFLLGLVLTIGIQSLLMKKTFNTYRLTYIDDITWYRYGGALATTIHENNCISNQCFREEQAKRDSIISNLSNDEMAMIAKADRKEILLKKTNAFIKMMKINISTNLLSGSFKESTWLNKWTVFNNLCLSILPFILYLVVLFSRFRRTLNSQLHLVVLFMLGVIAYTIITSGISAYQGDRFHIAFYPLSLLTIAIIIQKIRNVKLT